jgi:hypothetical protein
MIKLMSFLCVTAITMTTAHAEEYMSADQVRSLMTNMTFDGVYLPKNTVFSAYEDPDGTHNVLRSNGKIDEGRTWFVNDKGQHCTTNPKWKKKWPDGRCSYVKDAGNGEYYKINSEGKHTHTLKNFREGDQL